jgi:hypothetical protein
MNQQVEYLRLHRYQLTITAQLAKLGVQCVIVEAEFHVRFSRLFSRNNQVRLMKRSSVRQSLVSVFQSFSKAKLAIALSLRSHFMSGARAIGSASPTNPTLRLTAFLFGAVAYLTFFFTILYAIGFVSDFLVPKSIDAGVKMPISEAVAINPALMSLFALQHSVMARKAFKQWWTRFIPRPVERSTLFARLTLLLLFWRWIQLSIVVKET